LEKKGAEKRAEVEEPFTRGGRGEGLLLNAFPSGLDLDLRKLEAERRNAEESPGPLPRVKGRGLKKGK